jgi:hypothetical protein
MLRNPIKGVLLELNSVSNRSYQNYFLQADFSLSEKHLETGLAFNTRYSLRDLLQQRKQFQTWLIPLGVWSPRGTLL